MQGNLATLFRSTKQRIFLNGEIELKLDEGYGFHIFSKWHKVLFDEAKVFKMEAVRKFIIKVAMLSAVSFSEWSLLVVRLFSYSLIKFRAGFVLSKWLTYTFLSKISLHVEAEKKKMHINSNKPFKKEKSFETLSKRKFTCGIGIHNVLGHSCKKW